MAKKSGISILQEFWDSMTREEHGEWYIEYIPKKGYWSVPDTPRYLGDPGEPLGSTIKEAKKAIKHDLKWII